MFAFLSFYTKDAYLHIYDNVVTSHIYLENPGLCIYSYCLLSNDQWCLFRINSLKCIYFFLFKVWVYKSSTWKPKPESRPIPSFLKWHIQFTVIYLSLINSFIFFPRRKFLKLFLISFHYLCIITSHKEHEIVIQKPWTFWVLVIIFPNIFVAALQIFQV